MHIIFKSTVILWAFAGGSVQSQTFSDAYTRLYNSNVSGYVGQLVVDTNAGTLASPYKVYVPLEDNDTSGSDVPVAAISESNLNYLSVTAGVTLPMKSQALISVRVQNTSGSTGYVYLGVRKSSDTDYQAIDIRETPTGSANDNQSLGAGETDEIWFSLTDLCADGSTTCNAWSDTSNLSAGSSQKIFVVVNEAADVPTSFDPATYSSEGFHIELNGLLLKI